MRERRPTVDVVIDDHPVRAVEGETVLHAAARAGIEIPTLCHLEGLTEVGACRLCVVEIAEQHGLRPACATPVTEDMEVRTNTPRLRSHREMIVEMIFAEGNHVCSVCVASGHCELQTVAAAVGLDHVRMSYRVPRRPVDASHPRYVFDRNRCILCTRCVRTCDEIEGAHVWDVAYRGERATVVAELGGPWGSSTLCTQCGKCVAVCPTGALSAQHDGVGEVRHDRDLIARLVSARRDHDWFLPAPPAEPAPSVQPAPSVELAPSAPAQPAPSMRPGPVRRERPARLATVWLGGCAGCHMSLLDLDEALVDLAHRADLVYSPLADVKEFPDEVDLVLVEGAVANEENLELARDLRERSRLVVSLGDCAVNGNVTAMRNPLGDPEALLKNVYVDQVTRDGGIPSDGVPRLLRQVLPLHQVIQVDAYLPGCPPPAPAIAQVLTSLLDTVEEGRHDA